MVLLKLSTLHRNVEIPKKKIISEQKAQNISTGII
jgi:hypothetical protein